MQTSTAPARPQQTSPSPPMLSGALPLIGHVREFRAAPLPMFRRAAALGPLVRVRIGPRDAWVVNDPELVREVLVTRREAFTKQTRGYRALRLFLGDGLVTSEGDLWRRQRRIAQPMFLRKAVAGFGATMTACADEEATRWRALAAREETTDAAADMMRLTLRIAGLTLVSRDLGDASGPIGQAVTTVLESFTRLATSPLPWPERWPSRQNRAFHKAVRRIDGLVREIIAERRQSEGASPGDAGAPDLLDLFMAARDPETGVAMSDDLLRDEILTMLAAGHETTANALAWTLHLLAERPDIQDEVAAEIAAAGDLEGAALARALPLTDRVFTEALRLYPPVWLFARYVDRPETLGGVPMHPGSLAFFSPWSIHRDPKYWAEPDRFDPERWTSERVAARKREGQPREAFLPFSTGQRKCIGDHFAKLEALLLLASLLRDVRVAPGSERPVEPEPLLTLRPLGGLPLRLTLR